MQRIKLIIQQPQCKPNYLLLAIESTIDKLEENLKAGISEEELGIFFRVIDKLNNNIERIDSDND